MSNRENPFQKTLLTLPGCYRIQCPTSVDIRGTFTKTFRTDYFAELALNTVFPEEYITVSQQHVLRGLHFQVPPFELSKIIYCLTGQVMDVLLDIRTGSPTYGQYAICELSETVPELIYIPPGIAHGFYVHSASAILYYKVSKVYNATCDTGIHWSSAGIPWPAGTPIISRRDDHLLPLAEFASPFSFPA